MNQKKPVTSKNPMDAKYAPIRNIIVTTAKSYGVPPNVALAFAWLESGFNPNAEGDLQWAEWDNGSRYKKNVLGNPKLAKNPFRNIPLVWHSYGLFQLLAPYFVNELENPKVLLDPIVNAKRGIKKIASSLKAANGNYQQARIIYAGASKLNDETKSKLAARITAALNLFPTNL